MPKADSVTFQTWLIGNYRGKPTAFGDLAVDLAGDECWPDPATLQDARDHLHEHGASGNALIALDQAWEEYVIQFPGAV